MKRYPKIRNAFDACGIIEGFTVENPTLEQQLHAWAYLIRTRLYASLQGSYGRGAVRLMDLGVISKAGEIDWDKAEDMY